MLSLLAALVGLDWLQPCAKDWLLPAVVAAQYGQTVLLAALHQKHSSV
jgi:hypothetical protein